MTDGTWDFIKGVIIMIVVIILAFLITGDRYNSDGQLVSPDGTPDVGQGCQAGMISGAGC